MASAMVRNCVYRGRCPEMKCCGYYKTEAFKKELEEYWKLIGRQKIKNIIKPNTKIEMSIVEIENITLRERLKDIKEAFREVELLMGEVDGEIRIPKDEFENLKEAIYE